jgi:hypothetical protein
VFSGAGWFGSDGFINEAKAVNTKKKKEEWI